MVIDCSLYDREGATRSFTFVFMNFEKRFRFTFFFTHSEVLNARLPSSYKNEVTNSGESNDEEENSSELNLCNFVIEFLYGLRGMVELWTCEGRRFRTPFYLQLPLSRQVYRGRYTATWYELSPSLLV